MRSEGTPHILGCLARTRTPRLCSVPSGRGNGWGVDPRALLWAGMRRPVGAKRWPYSGKDSLLSDLATSAKMITTRSGGVIKIGWRFKDLDRTFSPLPIRASQTQRDALGWYGAGLWP
jgi:hypothetical protein